MTVLPARVLIVEDEEKVAQFIKKGLETQPFAADIALDGQEGKDRIDRQAYDLAILDVNLPLVDGLELCAYVRQKQPQMPVLMLTALGTTADKLAGFDAGADDYLVKPFDFMELLARVRALLKRSQRQADDAEVLRVADLELNLQSKEARRGGAEIKLTAREYTLLEYLMRNQGRVVSRVDIAENVWDIGFDTGTNYVDVYINYLRTKIDKNAPVKLIHTVVGLGYMMKEK
ncbi:MAG: response regulator transcription factor [Cytophagales bacterium]|nr:response regulator transcription factor [Cytophagales bacterium]